MKTIVVTNRLFDESFASCPEGFRLVMPKSGAGFDRASLLANLSMADALIPMFDLPVDAGLIEAAERLQVIANVGVGYNNIDLEAARRRGIAVCNTPYPVTEPTAELAMGLMIDVARGISLSDRRMRSQSERWGVMENIGHGVYGKILGIVGFGRIGQSLARRAAACGMRVVYYSRHRVDEAIERALGAQWLTLDELLKTADFISLNTPLTNETRHLIDAAKLALFKPTAYLINTARGAVVDETALVQALSEKRLAGAALDVFEFEPRVTAQLRQLDNTVIVPHIGTATREARNQMSADALRNVVGFFAGDPAISRVL
ncbi:MAG: dihydrofolate reductase [Paludibacteraceae bacterium]|nr:dihydrofolate reductase [Paludibacteraceae bacterium]